MKTANTTKIAKRWRRPEWERTRAETEKYQNRQKWLEQQIWPELQKFPSLDGGQNERVFEFTDVISNDHKITMQHMYKNEVMIK